MSQYDVTRPQRVDHLTPSYKMLPMEAGLNGFLFLHVMVALPQWGYIKMMFWKSWGHYVQGLFRGTANKQTFSKLNWYCGTVFMVANHKMRFTCAPSAPIYPNLAPSTDHGWTQSKHHPQVVTYVFMHLISPAILRIFIQQPIQASNEEVIWLLCRGSVGNNWIPGTKGHQSSKSFDGMKSSCA